MIHIEVLEDFRDRLTDGYETVTRQHPEIVAALTAAIKCMEKQVPMKPVYVPRKDNTTDYYECSSCHWGHSATTMMMSLCRCIAIIAVNHMTGQLNRGTLSGSKNMKK
jgi:hypothetical protein